MCLNQNSKWRNSSDAHVCHQQVGEALLHCLGLRTSPGEGVVKGEKFPNIRKPSHQWVCGEFWNLRGQHKVKERKKVNSLSCVRHFATL